MLTKAGLYGAGLLNFLPRQKGFCYSWKNLIPLHIHLHIMSGQWGLELLLFWPGWGPETRWKRHLSLPGLCIQPVVGSLSEAEKLLPKIRNWWGWINCLRRVGDRPDRPYHFPARGGSSTWSKRTKKSRPDWNLLKPSQKFRKNSIFLRNFLDRS